MNIRDLLNQRIANAMQAEGLPAECRPQVVASKKVGFGDYQANGVMEAAKRIRTNPRALAQRIVEHLEIDDIASQVDVAGPGFINLTLKREWLAEQLVAANNDPQLGVCCQQQQTVVVDYSSPNLAKEMHVGHLRSTIIGDALVRTLEFLGHTVIRQNHVGDWGTQFGMLIAELEKQLQSGESASLALKDIERFYQCAKKHFDESEEFAQQARDYVVKLQSGDEKILALWEQFRQISLEHIQQIYDTLNVTLTAKHVYGESAYNDDLATLVNELQQHGLATEDQGAQVVFLEEMADKDGNPSPVIVQKQDGGFLYATTDLAALRYRHDILKADCVLYLIDARQSLHINQVFTVARKANFISENIHLQHHAFGTMMGSDGKPFKTRSGGTVKLAELLEEAVERAGAVITEKDSALNDEERKTVARKIGIGAVKYADLSKTRTNDYLFSWESMLNFEGNTAPYLQYAYTRIRSIFRKAGIDNHILQGRLILEEDTEIALAIKTLQFSEVIEQVAKDAYFHLLCHYLYELAGLFMRFYEQCPILKEDIDATTRNSRLLLSQSVAKTLQTGLDLLGIETMERM